jgi:hypothetical protein
MVTVEKFIADVFYFIKTSLTGSITDPLSGSRQGKFILTSYPQEKVNYPIITIKMVNKAATRAGMQTTAMDVVVDLEIRVWGRNEKEKDSIYTQVYNRLKDIQFTTGGSTDSALHNFTELSATEVDEAGEGTPKSRVGVFRYYFYNVV